MKLRALDQVSISSVRSGVIAPGEEFEVSDAIGKELLEKRPNDFEKLAAGKFKKEDDVDGENQTKDDGAAPKNKDEGAAPKNKSDVFGGANKGLPETPENTAPEPISAAGTRKGK